MLADKLWPGHGNSVQAGVLLGKHGSVYDPSRIRDL